jgi:hypothetical protein
MDASEAGLAVGSPATHPMHNPFKIRFVPIRYHLAVLAAAVATSSIAQAALRTYTADAKTLHLYPFDEAADTSFTANLGTMGGSAITVRETSSNHQANACAIPTDMLGHTGFSGFGNAVRIFAKPVASTGGKVNPSGNEGVGYDANGDGDYSQGSLNKFTPDKLANYRSYFPGSYTFEAMINIPSIASIDPSHGRTIVSFDSSTENQRSIFFRIASGELAPGELQLVNASRDNVLGVSRAVAIPITGPDAFEPNAWFHVAVVHDASGGGSTQFYWTRVSPSRTQASTLGPRFTGPQAPNNKTASPTLALGSDSRHAFTQSLGGLLDNVRISNVARGPGDFIFCSYDIGLSVARDGHDISLGWTLPIGVTSLVNIYRNTKPEKDGRIQLAAIHVDSSTFADRLPSDVSTYWYWVGFMDRTGNYIENGPYEAKPTSVWQP